MIIDEKQKWSLKKENTVAKLNKSNGTVEKIADLLPGRLIPQIKANFVRMDFSSKKNKTHKIDSKKIKKQKICIFDIF